ncbi:MAG: L-serine ammonia-lyase, iron-sulfur-dependent, subunit alpha [Defluviitaleaceae bacterium]|nr:L-serine ammonia-lyase, iron-sulfur-dependent, subunit alpha [Defluviitaleaceae bacterium]
MINFNSVQAMIEQAEAEGIAISTLTLRQSAIDTERSEEAILQQMTDSLAVMKESVAEGCAEGLQSISGLTGDWAYQVKSRFENKGGFCGSFIGEVITNALAVMHVNACMGRIVAAPTAGSCGILPGCLIALQNHYDLTDEQLVNGLLNASAIGMVIAKNATLAGAEGACQSECGSAAAMAASAMTEVMGGTPTMCGHAAAQALKGLMGLVCDPVAGLVEEPCIIRNPTSAMVALCSAEMSLAGVPSLIPVDEVIKAMDAVGKSLPASLRETAEGGIAVSPTGKRLAEALQ